MDENTVDEEIMIGCFFKDRGWRSGDGTVEMNVTHWMPIIFPEILKGKNATQ